MKVAPLKMMNFRVFQDVDVRELTSWTVEFDLNNERVLALVHEFGPGFLHRANDGFLFEAFNGEARRTRKLPDEGVIEEEVIESTPEPKKPCCPCFGRGKPEERVQARVKKGAEISLLKISPCWRITLEPTQHLKNKRGVEVSCAWTYVIEVSLENSFDDVQKFILSLFAEPGCSFSLGEGGMPKRSTYVKIDGYTISRPIIADLPMIRIQQASGSRFEGLVMPSKEPEKEERPTTKSTETQTRKPKEPKAPKALKVPKVSKKKPGGWLHWFVCVRAFGSYRKLLPCIHVGLQRLNKACVCRVSVTQIGIIKG
jgi:hypothetical protein